MNKAFALQFFLQTPTRKELTETQTKVNKRGRAIYGSTIYRSANGSSILKLIFKFLPSLRLIISKILNGIAVPSSFGYA